MYDQAQHQWESEQTDLKTRYRLHNMATKDIIKFERMLKMGEVPLNKVEDLKGVLEALRALEKMF